MKKEYKCCSIKELLNLFNNSIETEDIIYADISAKISAIITKNRIEKNMDKESFSKYMNVSLETIDMLEDRDYNYTIQDLVYISNKLDLKLNIEIC